MKPAKIRLPFYVEGDRFDLIGGFGPVTLTINGVEEAPSVPLEKVRLEFRDKDGNLGYLYSSDGVEAGNIVITDANTWEGTFAAEDAFPLTEGCWNWDMEFYPQGYGAPYTLYKGVLRVLKQQTIN